MTGIIDFTGATLFENFEYSGFSSYVDMGTSGTGADMVDVAKLTAMQDQNIILSDIRFLLITFIIFFLFIGFYILINDLLGKK